MADEAGRCACDLHHLFRVRHHDLPNAGIISKCKHPLNVPRSPVMIRSGILTFPWIYALWKRMKIGFDSFKRTRHVQILLRRPTFCWAICANLSSHLPPEWTREKPVTHGWRVPNNNDKPPTLLHRLPSLSISNLSHHPSQSKMTHHRILHQHLPSHSYRLRRNWI